MKIGIIFSIALLFTILFVSGQNQFNIVENTSKWSVITNYGGFYDTHFIRFGTEDTLIGGLPYRKVYNSYDPNGLNWTFMDLFIRENTTSRQVFLRNMIGEEGMLYDFSIELGDTVTIRNVISGPNVKLKVIGVDSVFIYDAMRKRYHFEAVTWPIPDVWIEGIGSRGQGIIYSGFYNTSPWYTLLCYKQDDVVYYMNPEYTACYYPYISISEKEKDYPKVYYSAKLNLIQIENIPESNLIYFELYNLFGQKEIYLPISGKTQISLDQNGLKDGLFIYVLKHKEYIHSEKLMIIKNK